MMAPEPRITNLPAFAESNGLLVVPSELETDFGLQRVFFVRGDAGDIRGQHAHRQCSQLLVCVTGSVEVLASNGATERRHRLDDPTIGLLVPPMIWCEQVYESKGSVLLVLCDREYDEADYIRDRDEYDRLTHDPAVVAP